ncbi:unnamed protein product [Mortierella alpina]
MTRAAIHSITDIPELTASIACYLIAADVARAMAACQTWSVQFQPFLWTHYSSKYSRLPLTTLAQNLHHIRTIELNARDVYSGSVYDWEPLNQLLKTLACGVLTHPEPRHSTEPASGCERKQHAEGGVSCHTSLKQFSISVLTPTMGRENTSWYYLRKLFHQSIDNLTHLRVRIINDDIIPPTMVQGISGMRHLQHLTFTAFKQEQCWFFSLLRACLPLPKLSELYCDFIIKQGTYSGQSDDRDLSEPTGELENILDEAIAARTSEDGSIGNKITALGFPRLDEGHFIGCVLALLRSDLVDIVTLKLPKPMDSRAKGFYEDMAREHCPALRHLIISLYYGDDMSVCEFIRGASNLKTVRAIDYWDDTSNLAGGWLPELVKCHSNTLEELEFPKCISFDSVAQQTILTSCKQLRRFWVVPQGLSIEASGLKFKHILDHEWSCVKLRELCLSMDRAIDIRSIALTRLQELPALSTRLLSWIEHHTGSWIRDLDSAGWQELEYAVDAWAAKKVFSQIGRLACLEVLALGAKHCLWREGESLLTSQWDLTLSRGHLGELSGLRNLRHLHMRTDYWSKMGQAEVEFMDAEWPLLGDISFGLEKGEVQDVVKQPHWQWLHQKRPHLRLSAFHV